MTQTIQKRTGFNPSPPRDGFGGATPPPADRQWLDAVKFSKPLDSALFDEIAQKVARRVAMDGSRPKASNKPTQIRRFYDEICLWAEKIDEDEEKFKKYEPLIRMINAKAAYALGRNKLVDQDFADLLRHGLRQVDSAEKLADFKLFMEAFMGFYKHERPKD
ncbi:MAG: type III-A CRISPR-associated protein Csm2 [Magnetococcales bacterium]|nr:type III-A CRISPR-associated protein Csm2 [Magnetococcales bacterium]